MENKGSTNSRPLISVVMPVYNGGEFLRDAIESILSQTWQNFEFIIIDDGSKDKSDAVILSYKDERIHFTQQSNHGLAYTLNKGFELAQGDFIARMDQDDISLPSRLEKQAQYLATNSKVGVVGTFFTYMDESKTFLPTTITAPTKHYDLHRSLYIVNPLGHGTTMIRKAAWKEASGYSDKYGPTEDYELWRRIAENWDLGVIPESLYWYRINPSGMSATGNDVQHDYSRKIADEQWAKPFLFKSYGDIVTDAKYYRNIDPIYGKNMYYQYAHEQFLIAKGMLHRRMFVAGCRTMLAAMRLDRSKWLAGTKNMLLALLRLRPWPILRGILRRLRLKR